MGSILREVLSQRNILVISLTTSFWSIINMLYMPYWSLYLQELGASLEAVGLLNMIQASSWLIFQLPGGFLADRVGRKKVIVYFTLTNILSPICFLWARTWEQIIPGILLGALSSVYMPAFNAMISESIPYERRGAGFGAYRMITSIPWTFSAFLGGIVMDRLGVIYGVRLFLKLTIVATVVITLIRALFLQETLRPRKKKEDMELPQLGREEGGALSVFKRAPKAIYLMLLTASISSFGMRLIMPYIVIYAVREVGLTKTQWGLISMTTGLISTLLAIPGGVVSDRIGRKAVILIGRTLSPISFLGLSLSRNFMQIFLVQMISAIGTGFGGGVYGGMGGPAWQALVADLVPSRMRARIMGLMGTITGLSSLPSPILGGYLYDDYSPQVAFLVAFALGIVGATIFAIFVKEPKKREV